MNTRNQALMLALTLSSLGWAQHTFTLPTDLADASAQVQDVHVGLHYSEGPAIDASGTLFFSENPDTDVGVIWKITTDGTKSVFKDPSRGSNGLEFDNQQRLHIAMKDSLLRIETDGKVTALAGGTAAGKALARVNDLSISSTGAVFFTNLNGNTVFFRNTDGQIRTRDFSGCNGIEWVEEKSIVYIGGGSLQKCAVNNATGEIGTCSQFAGATDGLTIDLNGNVWRANWSEGKVYAHDSTGRQLGSITINAATVSGKRSSNGAMGNASNCHFGGPDLKTLFITGDGGLYKIQLKVAGRRRPGWPGATLAISMAPKASDMGKKQGQGAILRFFHPNRGVNPVSVNGRLMQASRIPNL
jgi:gluconolactonase